MKNNEILEVISLYKQGLNKKEIVEKTGFRKEDVADVLRKFKFCKGPKMQQVLQLYFEGLTAREIGQKLNIKVATVRQYLRLARLFKIINYEKRIFTIDQHKKAYLLEIDPFYAPYLHSFLNSPVFIESFKNYICELTWGCFNLQNNIKIKIREVK